MALTAEVRLFRYGFHKNPPKVEYKDLILEFGSKQPTVDKTPEQIEEEVQRQAAMQKIHWFSMVPGAVDAALGEEKPKAVQLAAGPVRLPPGFDPAKYKRA